MDTSELDAAIAALQAQKARVLALAEAEERARKAKEKEKVLVDVTPTKAKPKVEAPPSPPKAPAFTVAFKKASSLLAKSSTKPVPPAQAPRASGLAASLAKRRAEPRMELPALRSSGFRERVPTPSSASGLGPAPAPGPSSCTAAKGKGKAGDDDELEIVRTGNERNDDLTVATELPMGPGEFGLDPEGEEVWRALEPNSGIRLAKRVLPHEDVQDLLYGRFHLRPPQIYNTVRLSRDGATYDVPVDGDWVTIAVVAERGDIRVSGMREAVSDEEDDEDDKNTSKSNPTDKEKSKDPKSKLASAKNRKQGGKSGGHGGAKKRRPRKYINLKLVALPPRNKTLGGGMTTSGDALLQLLLFESDAIVHTGDGNGGKTRSYRGGSGGAYERWCNLGVGSVIAVLNPRVLRPLKAGGAPHPLTLPLALNPQSDDSIQLIGHAMDIGRCTALQRDGNRCTTWVDTRLNSVCEYHVHAAVKRGRASRAEFASATTSFELESRTRAAAPSRFGAGPNSNREGDYSYNPQLRRGLLPASASRAAPRGSENGGGGATYVVGSGIARTDGGFGDAHLAERLGRSQAEKRKRKLEAAEAEAAMNKILERRDDTSVGAKYLAAAGKGPVKKGEQAERKRVFNAMAIRRIGFDPSGVRDEDADKRSSSIASLKEASNRPLRLGRPAGPKRLSNAVVPVSAVAPKVKVVAPEVKAPPKADESEDMIDLD